MLGWVSLGLRCAAFLWTLLLTALLGNVIATNLDAAPSATAAVNYCMFVTVIAWFACLYGLATFLFASLSRPVVLVFMDGSLALFSFIAAIVLAAKLKAVNCGTIDPKNQPGDWIAWGSANDEKRCRELQASTAFMWFLLLCFCGSLAVTVKEARSTFGGSVLSRSVLSSKPSMSQLGV